MRINLLEPYYGGSHRAWADGYRRFSLHDVALHTMPAQFWKWRMQGAAITLARRQRPEPDLIFASSMIDLSIFRSLTYRRLGKAPIALYFHENQLSYPQNQRQHHGWRYGFINYVSALAADAVYFNSEFHLQDFMQQLPRMLKHFGDYNELESIEQIRAKSSVLALGLDLRRFDAHRCESAPRAAPLILWNHRWQYDKDPAAFVHAMLELADAGYDFQLAITGESFGARPEAFMTAEKQLGDRIIQFGYLESFAEYAKLLWRADIVVSTAWQEFFGAAICEAIYCGCLPILPDRLNYPALISDELKSTCLYQRGKLTGQLRYHLDAGQWPDTSGLRDQVAAFDWRVMAPRYDDELEALVNRQR